MNTMFENKTLKCLPRVFIFCSNSRKSSRDATEECPESEHDAKQRSEGPTSKGNQVLNRSRDSTNDLDDITSKKVCGWPSEEPLFLHHDKEVIINVTSITVDIFIHDFYPNNNVSQLTLNPFVPVGEVLANWHIDHKWWHLNPAWFDSDLSSHILLFSRLLGMGCTWNKHTGLVICFLARPAPVQ